MSENIKGDKQRILKKTISWYYIASCPIKYASTQPGLSNSQLPISFSLISYVVGVLGHIMPSLFLTRRRMVLLSVM